MKKAVFIRLDKIGDLLCTLPVDQIESLVGWDITWIISKGLSFIPENANPKRKYIEIDKARPAEARQALQDFLLTEKPDVAVSFQGPWWVNFLLWKTGIKKRIGVLSKWDSFLFLNAGLRQKRSRSDKHEADYNLELIQSLLSEKSKPTKAPTLSLKAPLFPEVLAQDHLAPQGYSVVHPGMAGSALNWPTRYYIELINHIRQTRKVVLTGTAADEFWLKEIKTHFANDRDVISLQGKLTPPQLLYVLEQAHSVFAPSTGVLHLAAGLGVPTYGVYSPIRVQTDTRWGARGPQVSLFSPAVPCPADHQCLGPQCSYYPCMDTITPKSIIEKMKP